MVKMVLYLKFDSSINQMKLKNRNTYNEQIVHSDTSTKMSQQLFFWQMLAIFQSFIISIFYLELLVLPTLDTDTFTEPESTEKFFVSNPSDGQQPFDKKDVDLGPWWKNINWTVVAIGSGFIVLSAVAVMTFNQSATCENLINSSFTGLGNIITTDAKLLDDAIIRQTNRVYEMHHNQNTAIEKALNSLVTRIDNYFSLNNLPSFGAKTCDRGIDSFGDLSSCCGWRLK